MYSTVIILALTAMGNPAPEAPAAETTSSHGLSVGLGIGAALSSYFPQHTSSRDHRIEQEGLNKQPSAEVSLEYRYLFDGGVLGAGIKFGYAAFVQDDGAFTHTYASMPLLGIVEFSGELTTTGWRYLLGGGLGKVWNQSSLEAGDGFISESGNHDSMVMQWATGLVYPYSDTLSFGIEHQFKTENRVNSHAIVFSTDYLIILGGSES